MFKRKCTLLICTTFPIFEMEKTCKYKEDLYTLELMQESKRIKNPIQKVCRNFKTTLIIHVYNNKRFDFNVLIY